jgi:hypothetical protein
VGDVARLALMAASICLLVACNVLGQAVPKGGPYPEACASLDFPAPQCEAIVAVAQANASITPETVTSIDILPPPPRGGVWDHGMIARVRFHHSALPDQTVEVWCTGLTSEIAHACFPDAQIRIDGHIDHDTPCGIDGKTCATLPPSPRPAVQAIARPLRVASLDIPLDHSGPYEVEVGEAGLPDGVLSTLSGSLAETDPETFWIAEGISIEARPVDPSRPPLHSVFREPFDGVEPVKVFLVFDVTELKSDSVLQVRNLIVE